MTAAARSLSPAGRGLARSSGDNWYDGWPGRRCGVGSSVARFPGGWIPRSRAVSAADPPRRPVKLFAGPADENRDDSGGFPPAARPVDLVSWPYSRLLGRPLDADELAGPGPYMSIQVGGPLEGFVTLTADVVAQQVSVVSRWGSGSLRHEQNATGLDMETGEALAARWADKLAAGHEPVAA